MILKSRLISIFLFIIIIISQLYFDKPFCDNNAVVNNCSNNEIIENIVDEKNETNAYKQKIENQNDAWKVTIKKINVNAEIADGVTPDVLNKYVGHFKQSGYASGNIALAAHNRGYAVNYFNKIKELNIGDEIEYSYMGKVQVYLVYENRVIEDTNVEVVENTSENIITLITCVENKPAQRRCIRGKLKQ